jgi:hypothetical protein
MLGLIPFVTVPIVFAKSLFIFLLLCAATVAVSYFSQKTQLKRAGLELVTFTTVVAGVMYGIIPGAIVGIVLVVIHDLLSHRIAGYLLIVVPLFGAIGALASVFAGADIVLLGMGLTIFSHIIFVLWQSMTHRFPVTYMPYLAANVLLNFFLFKNFAPTILSIIK